MTHGVGGSFTLAVLFMNTPHGVFIPSAYQCDERRLFLGFILLLAVVLLKSENGVENGVENGRLKNINKQ